MWDDTARMLIPGELEHERMQQRLTHGLPLRGSLLADLIDIAGRLDVAVPNTTAA